MSPLDDSYSMAYFATLVLKSAREKFGLSYPELAALESREHIVSKTIDNYGILHHYGSEGILAALEADLGVTFVQP